MVYKKKKLTKAWKIWMVTCCILLCISIVQPAFAEIEGGLRVMHEYDTRILMNGTYLTSEIMAEISDNRVAMLPLQEVFEAAGYTVSLDSTNKEVIIHLMDGEKLVLDITNGKAYLSGTEVGTFPYKVKNGKILTTPDFFHLVDGIDAKYDVATHTTIISVTPARPNDVIIYDIGNKLIKLPSGSELNITLNGGIAVPASQNNPIVMILHGSHPMENATDNRYDLGFSYLLKSLASQGYVALSLNVNLQYSFLDGEPIGQERLITIVEETLAALKLANDGNYKGFGADLTGKLDLSKLVLVGHSRGGGGIIYVADALQKDKDVKVMGLVAFAPTEVYVEDLKSTDIPTAFIIPELDGDVVSLDGYTYFDTLVSQANRNNDLQLIYLYGANHNAFNEGVVPQDLGKIWYTGEKIAISAKEQRDFTTKYVIAFTNAVTSRKPLHKIANSSDEKLFGYKAMVSNSLVGSLKIFDAHDNTLTANRATLEQVISSNMMNNNTAGLFNPGGFNQNLELLKISWKEQGANVAFAMSEATQDLSKMDLLSLYLAPDSTSPLNDRQNQSFRVELVDINGKVASYVIDSNTPALAYQEGHPIFEGDIFSTITPLGIIGIQLTAFNQIDLIDLTQITDVRLNFSENTSGCIMVRSIFVSKATPLPGPESESKEIAEQTKKGAVYILVALAGVLIVGITTITLLKKYRNKKSR